MDNFQKAFEFSLHWEGGYSDHPADRGGATMRGITQATYDAYLRSIGAPSRPVKSIRDEEIEWIYHRNYWNEIKGDSLPMPLAIAVFDCAVNSGPSRSIKLLQAACGVAIDGALGPVTLEAAKSVDVAKAIDQREAFLRRIVVRDPSQQVFLRGWMSRIAALRAACNGG